MANKNQNLPTKAMKRRASLLMTSAFCVLFTVVAGNFFKISVLENKKYQDMANDRHFGSIIIPAHRGSIYDAKSTALAKSATVYKVFLDPKCFREDLENLQKKIDKRATDIKNGTYQPSVETITDENGVEHQVVIEDNLPVSAEYFKQEVINLLSQKLEIKPEAVEEAMGMDSQYAVLQKQVEKPVADELLSFFSKNGFVSLNVEEDTKRYYLQSEYAAPVIGFTNADGHGMYGLEAYYDDYLSGTD
nr:peptidoglycan glycosyltransferase [Ruminococcus sp.]